MKTPILAWAVFGGTVALVLPDAAPVGAQEVAEFSIEEGKKAGKKPRQLEPDPDQERHERVALLGVVTSGGPARAIDPPTDTEVMQVRSRLRSQKPSPGYGKVRRGEIRIIKEKTAEFVDPARYYPLVGRAQLHHAHYKCSIYFTEQTTNDLTDEAEDPDAVEVVYLDHNHFHVLGKPDTDDRVINYWGSWTARSGSGFGLRRTVGVPGRRIHDGTSRAGGE